MAVKRENKTFYLEYVRWMCCLFAAQKKDDLSTCCSDNLRRKRRRALWKSTGEEERFLPQLVWNISAKDYETIGILIKGKKQPEGGGREHNTE